MKPALYIFTGPPGSGKSTKSQEIGVKVYDRDLGNKLEWMTQDEDAALCTAAPSKENKDYWVKQAKENGFVPVLYVVWTPRMTALDRMLKRDGQSPDQRNNLNKDVERWYKLYSPHHQEELINNG